METTKLRDVSSSRGGWRTLVEKPFMGRKPHHAIRHRGNRIFRLWLYQYGYAREGVTSLIRTREDVTSFASLSRPHTRGCHSNAVNKREIGYILQASTTFPEQAEMRLVVFSYRAESIEFSVNLDSQNAGTEMRIFAVI